MKGQKVENEKMGNYSEKGEQLKMKLSTTKIKGSTTKNERTGNKR
jgi:hypothetical protein